MSPFKLLSLAAQVSRLRDDNRRYYLGAVGVRKDGVIVASPNGNSKEPEPKHHAEARVIRKLTRHSSVYVCRTLANGDWALAQPCPDCIRAMYKSVDLVFWTTGPEEWLYGAPGTDGLLR